MLLVVLVGALCSYLHARKPRCVIVADDFGISMERSRGIIRALKNGVVTNTSVMANGDAAVEAIEMARANGLIGVVGLHLNLTEGRPLSWPQDIPSLLLQRGETHQPGTGLSGGALRGTASVMAGALPFKSNVCPDMSNVNVCPYMSNVNACPYMCPYECVSLHVSL